MKTISLKEDKTMKQDNRQLSVEELQNVSGGNYWEVKDLIELLIWDDRVGAKYENEYRQAYEIVMAAVGLNEKSNPYNDDIAVEMMRLIGFEGDISKHNQGNTYILNGKSMTHQEVLNYLKNS